jgi:hypothetical protein
MLIAAVELRHGYTIADLEKIAKISVARDVWNQAIPPADRFDLSFSGMAELLYGSEEPPTLNDLYNAAYAAVRRDAQSNRSAHGISNVDVHAPAPNFWRYWWEQARHTQGPETRVIDRVALQQIFVTLSPRFQRVLLALAAHDDHDKAAAALGITRSTYNTDLSDARRAFYRLWHEGETPSRLWAADRRGKGNENVMHSIVRRRKRHAAKG